MKSLLLPLLAGSLLFAAAPAHAATKLDPAWTGSGANATLTQDGSKADPQLDYNAPTFSGTWTLTATAASTRTVPVAYRSTGFWGWYQVQTKLERFIVRGGKEVLTEQLKAEGPVNCCSAPSGGFDYQGKTSFDVQKGDVYGFRMSGSNYSADHVMRGTLSAYDVDSTGPAVTPVLDGPRGANGSFTGPVKVSWKIDDPDSRVLSSKGCDPVTVSAQTAGQTLTCEATSRGGTTKQPVTVAVDSTAPELTVPAAVALQAPNAAGAVATFATGATDNLDPAPVVTCTPGSGSLLPVGTTKVSCTATDAAGNATTKTFDALVVAPAGTTTILSSTNSGPKTINALLSFRFKIDKQTTKLVQLTVRNVPKGAKVLVTCQGPTCPKALRGKGRTLVSKGSTVSLATLVRGGLKKGTTINVTISSPGAVTAIKTLTVRKGMAPVVR